MAYSSLRDFIDHLEKEKKLVRITEPVSADLEMTEIGCRVLKDGGPALLFENPIKCDGTKSTMPVLTNLFGTVERVAMGINAKPEDLRNIGHTLAELRQPEPPSGFKDALDKLPMLKKAMTMRPKTVKKAPVHEVVLTGDDIDLSMLPIQKCWPDDASPLITWPLVVSKGPGKLKEDDFNLGPWVSTQRANKDTLTPERIERLNALGFVWDPLTEQWEEGFSKLQQFKERERHCRVPQEHKEGDFTLGSWVGTQRSRKDKLTPERIKRLDALGFVWKVR